MTNVRVPSFRAQVGEAAATVVTAEHEVPELAGATFSDIEQGMPQFGRVEGVIVSKVEPAVPGSPAHRNGLRQGDVVIAVNRQRIHDVDELRKVLEARGRVLAPNVLRGNAQFFIVIQ